MYHVIANFQALENRLTTMCLTLNATVQQIMTGLQTADTEDDRFALIM